MTLGEFVRKTREARGLTQEELATLSGLGRSYISLIELDRIQETSSTKILKLAKALRVKPDEMYIAQALMSLLATKPYITGLPKYLFGEVRHERIKMS